MFYVYLIHNLKSREIYIGFTCDLRKRIQKHNTNSVRSTKNQGEWELVYYESYKSEKDARRRAINLKKQGMQREFVIKNLEESLRK